MSEPEADAAAPAAPPGSLPAASRSQSYLWVLRSQAITALLALLLAELHTWSPELHAGLLGFATGILLVLVAMSFLPRLRITRDRARRASPRPVVPITHRRQP